MSWTLRLGRVHEALADWPAADAAYARCLELIDRSPAGEHRRAGIYYRQAQVRVRREDWDEAQTALADAVRLRPDAATWHAQLGTIYEHQQEWIAAAGSYRRATELAPERPAYHTGLVRTTMKAGRVPEAVTAGESGLAGAPAYRPLRQALAEAYEAAGDWHGAARVLRGLVADRPRDHSLRSRLVRCLEQLLRVPPALTGRPGTAGEEAAIEDEVAGHLRRLAERPARRPNDWFRLGLFYERRGRLAEAAEAYQVAMERLSATDSPWCHKSAYDWEFRLAYVREQLSPSTSAPPHLRRRVTPAAGPPAGAEPAGFVDALIAREGLQLSGFLLPGSGEVVDIHVDDLLLKQVRVNAASWRPSFRFDPSPGLLGDLPERSRLTVRAGGRPLVTTGGGAALEVSVPGGSGKLRQKLAAGLSPTKKGSWPLNGRGLADRRTRYLDLYEEARQLLATGGRQLFLTYGTLLGCVRNGEFITGDDDFDASYVSHAPDPASFRHECLQVALELLRHGMDIRFAINGRMLQFGRDGVWVDVSPTWFYQGRAWSFTAHDLALESIEPTRPGTLAGRSVYLPRDPAALLADAYGPDWRTPQPAFRHYRSAADNQVLATMWARPSEVREFTRLAATERRHHSSAGRFKGVGGTPAYPGFSWLTPAPEPDPPAATVPAVPADRPAVGGRSGDR
jgi:tetratricopeptide (TPR) repeat protein